MTDLPKTRKWNVRRKSAFMDQVQTDLDLADAMRDELLGRISELEDVLEMESENRTSMTARIEELEASLKLMTEYGYWKGRAEQAEAALAERDRMLRLAVELLAGMVSDHGPRDVTEDEVLADLKARAEEGSEDE